MLIGAFVILALLAAVANPVVRAVSGGRGIGALIAECDGKVAYDRYDRVAAVSAGVLPAWFPRDATVVTVVRPGPKQGLSTEARVDAVVAPGTAVPAICTPSTSWSMPFDLSGDWPSYRVRDLRECGEWTLAARPGHWYLWRDGDVPAGT